MGKSILLSPLYSGGSKDSKGFSKVSKATGVKTDWTHAEQAPTLGLFTHGGLFHNTLLRNICMAQSLTSFRSLLK